MGLIIFAEIIAGFVALILYLLKAPWWSWIVVLVILSPLFGILIGKAFQGISENYPEVENKNAED